MEDENIDAVLLQAPLAFGTKFLSNIFHFSAGEIKAFEERQKRNLSMLRQRVAEYGKPVFVVMPVNDLETNSYLLREKIPAYTSPWRVARVLGHLAWYRNYLDSNQK